MTLLFFYNSLSGYTYIRCLLLWRLIVSVLWSKNLPSNEIADIDRFCAIDRLWSPSKQTRDWETEDTGRKCFICLHLYEGSFNKALL